MKLFLNKSQYFDSKQGIDISIPLKNGSNNVNAWYADPVEIKPVVNGEFIGDVNQGGPVNFKTVFLNPHGNGTHTECVGHISTEHFTINQCLKEHHFLGQVLTVEPTVQENKQEGVEDKVITKACLEKQLDGNFSGEVLAIRTLPNGHEKSTQQYSNTNPPYLTEDAMQFINELGVEHLMVDMPSVDREEDGGALVCHRTFWNYPENVRQHKTITELIYVPENVADGVYLFEIQITSLEMDASPSKIMIYELKTDQK